MCVWPSAPLEAVNMSLGLSLAASVHRPWLLVSFLGHSRGKRGRGQRRLGRGRRGGVLGPLPTQASAPRPAAPPCTEPVGRTCTWKVPASCWTPSCRLSGESPMPSQVGLPGQQFCGATCWHGEAGRHEAWSPPPADELFPLKGSEWQAVGGCTGRRPWHRAQSMVLGTAGGSCVLGLPPLPGHCSLPSLPGKCLACRFTSCSPFPQAPETSGRHSHP